MAIDPKARAEANAKAYEKLKLVRASKTVSLKPITRLKDIIIGFDKKPEPFKLRYYQVQGAFHLMLIKRLILGDGTGLGKTVEAVAAMAYLWEKEPKNKVIVVAPKSAIEQWADDPEVHERGEADHRRWECRAEEAGLPRVRQSTDGTKRPKGRAHHELRHHDP